MSMRNFNDTIENRNRDLPACSAVPQSNCATACPPLVSKKIIIIIIINFYE